MKPLGGINVDLTTDVDNSYTNNGLINSVLHQTFGSSLNLSLIVFASLIILMIIGGLISYSVYTQIQRHGAAIRHIQEYLRSKSSQKQVCSSV